MKRLIGVGIVLILAFGVLQATAAGGVPSYSHDWWTVDGGGESAVTAGRYTLGATAGQPDAAVVSGGRYVLEGGFWRGGASSGGTRKIFTPIIVKSWH